MTKDLAISLYSLILVGLIVEWCCVFVILFGGFDATTNRGLWLMAFGFAAMSIYCSIVVQIVKEGYHE